jgi:formate dehydrogenase major subunit
VKACPTATLQEKSVIWLGQPEHSTITTCAYCGVGCGFKAEMKGNEVVRMVPWKDGKANEGHSCVKGRFAWGYATHKDRITKPMIRARSPTPGARSAGRSHWLRGQRVPPHPGQARQGFGGRHHLQPLHQRRTYLVQKLVRAAFGNNNVDTCARVCHSPTGYGLGRPWHVGRHADLQVGGAGRRDHGDRRQPDRGAPGVCLAHEAPPAPGRQADRGGPAPDRPGQLARM